MMRQILFITADESQEVVKEHRLGLKLHCDEVKVEEGCSVNVCQLV